MIDCTARCRESFSLLKDTHEKFSEMGASYDLIFKFTEPETGYIA